MNTTSRSPLPQRGSINGMLVALILAALVGAGSLHAQLNTSVWQNATGGWESNALWSTGVPLAGTNAMLGGTATYTVTYSNRVNYSLGNVTITNSAATLIINTNGFNTVGLFLRGGQMIINAGGVVTNSGSASGATNTATLTINGGIYAHTTGSLGGFGNGTAGTTPLLQMYGGEFSYGGSSGTMGMNLAMTGGVLRFLGTSSSALKFVGTGSVISGGAISNLGTKPLDFAVGASATLTNNGLIFTPVFSMGGLQSGTVKFNMDGGSLVITNGFYVGDNGGAAANQTMKDFFLQTGGTVDMTGSGGLVIGLADRGFNVASSNLYALSGGTLNTPKITLMSIGTSNGVNILQVSGGTINLNSGGLVTNTPGSNATYRILLSGGILGAQQAWSSVLDMTLTNTGVGAVAFRAADTNGAAQDITLSGALTGNGGLTKTGAGTLTLLASNSFSGALGISAGQVVLGHAMAASGATVSNAVVGGLVLSNAATAWTFGGLGGSLDFGLTNRDGSVITLILAGSQASTFNGALNGSGTLIKTGTGTQVLAGNNTWSGGTALSNGTLSISSDANLGGTGTPFTFGGGTLQVTGTSLSNLNSHPGAWGGALGFDIVSVGHTFTVTNNLDATAGALSAQGAGNLVFSGLVTNGGLVKAGSGTLVLANAGLTNFAFASGNAGALKVTGGQLSASNLNLGAISGDSESLEVQGSGASVVLSGALTVGKAAGGQRLVVTNGAQLSSAANSADLGSTATSSDNEVLITGMGSVWTAKVATLGTLSSSNRLIVAKGGVVNFTGSPSSPIIGYGGSDNEVRVLDGGIVGFVNGGFIIGNSNGLTYGSNNRLVVSGQGSVVSNFSNLNISYAGNGNGVIVSNGGTLVSGNTYVGRFVVSTGAYIHVTGAGSVLSVNNLYLGSNSLSKGASSRVLVEEGGTLEVTSPTTSMLGDFSGNGTFTNRSGILQFTINNPTLTPGTANSFVMTNGIISYRGIATADITTMRITTNITMQGNSGFRLLDATNATGLAAYTFDSVANTGVSTNFQRLVLAGANSQWRSGVLTIGAGGELYTSNSTGASIAALVTNSGTIKVYDSILTYQSNVVLNGGTFLTQRGTNVFTRGLSLAGNSTFTFTNGSSRMTGVVSNNAGSTIRAINSIVTWQDAVVVGGQYYSDPSTNIFVTNVTVTTSGSLSGSNGDLFVFGGNLLNQSTNRDAFSLWQAMVIFTNVAGTSNHVFNLADSLAYDMGTPSTNLSFYGTNFAIGKLSVAAGNFLQLTGQFSGGVSNALYVGALDLGGSTNLLGSLLDLDINLYYDNRDLANAYLNGQTYQLAGWSGSLLPLSGLPIPEPSVFALLGLAALLALRRRKTA